MSNHSTKNELGQHGNQYFDSPVATTDDPVLTTEMIARQGIKFATGDVKSSEVSPYAIQGTIAPAIIVPHCPETVSKKPMSLNHEKLNPEKSVITEDDKIEEKKIVEKMNKTHAIVHIDRCWVLTEKKDPIFGGRDFILESRQSFRDSYENKTIKCSDDKTRSWADVWLKSPLRREFKGISFDPHNDRFADGYYNIWTGFAVNLKQGDCSKFWYFVKETICAGDEKNYSYLRKWMAYVVQHPDEVHTVIVLCGSQGVGKNTFMETYGALWGKHYKQLACLREALSKFNYHHKDGVFFSVSEANWEKGDSVEVFKATVTDPLFVLEAKGKDQITMKNYRHFMCASNSNMPIHVEHDDRRCFFLNVSENRKGDQDFFADIRKERANGGLNALLWDLFHEDLSNFNPRTIPITLSAFDAKIDGGSSVEKYTYEILKDGCFDAGNGTPLLLWPEKVMTAHIYNDFKSWCANNVIKPINEREFGKQLMKILPITKYRLGTGDRKYEYTIPSLNEARIAFQKYCQIDGRCWED